MLEKVVAIKRGKEKCSFVYTVFRKEEKVPKNLFQIVNAGM